MNPIFTSLQTSSLGRAYVREGGFYKRNISIVLEAHNIDYLSYNIQFYGVL